MTFGKHFASASRAALAAALTLGLVAVTPAEAQRGRDKKEEAPAQRKLKLSKPVQKIAGDAQKLQAAGDHAGALAKLAEADALPKEDDDAEVLGKLRLQSGVAMKDNRVIEAALTELTDLGTLPQPDQIQYLAFVANLALQREDYAKAAAFFDKHNALQPNNPAILVNAAETFNRLGDTGKAMTTLKAAIDAKNATGEKAEESWYKRRVSMAVDSGDKSIQTDAFIDWVKAYPSPTSWRDAVLLTRDSFPGMDDQTLLDFSRFQAASKSMAGERDFVEYADTALGRGYPGEAKAAIDAGIAANELDPAKPLIKELKNVADSKAQADKAGLGQLEKEVGTNARLALATGDAFYGFAQYAKAAELYRKAQGATNVDAATVNLRLGAALAMAGDKTAAAEALKAVDGGARAALAKYWLAFIGA
ncbi:MAG: tetratricopeptide repeat protein [Polymorphobacter sp.]|uniref:tetratricopeptide repeat protein n=1 Tax=Polymorphobacter sp. TaxID=1909290 RepID=UPI003A87F170